MYFCTWVLWLSLIILQYCPFSPISLYCGTSRADPQTPPPNVQEQPDERDSSPGAPSKPQRHCDIQHCRVLLTAHLSWECAIMQHAAGSEELLTDDRAMGFSTVRLSKIPAKDWRSVHWPTQFLGMRAHAKVFAFQEPSYAAMQLSNCSLWTFTGARSFSVTFHYLVVILHSPS